jgi:hypothetical protein
MRCGWISHVWKIPGAYKKENIFTYYSLSRQIDVFSQTKLQLVQHYTKNQCKVLKGNPFSFCLVVFRLEYTLLLSF